MKMENSIQNKEQYQAVMAQIEKYLQKATQTGGFHNLDSKEVEILRSLSLQAEKYEDSMPIMPISQPKTLVEMIHYKMFENRMKQKELAAFLGITEARFSEVLGGKRKVTIDLAKRLYEKLNIDADFILKMA
jgi:HTH-type transcriptional regulator / antitoxin HigA